MRDLVLGSLSRGFDPAVAADLLDSYDQIIGEFRKADFEAALNAAGKFVENTLRAIECIRSGVAPKEIKSVAATIKSIETDGSLDEALRILIPRVASTMLFDLRSKRGAAHVKDISPRYIDASLVAQAASWIMAEFVRLLHVTDENEVAEAMAALMAGSTPLLEMFEDELVVTTPLAVDTEVLLLVSSAGSKGMNRKGIGASIKHSPPSATRAVQRLMGLRYLHKSKSDFFHITGPGERQLVTQLAKIAGVVR